MVTMIDNMYRLEFAERVKLTLTQKRAKDKCVR